MSSQAKIEETLRRSVCGGWDRGFLESILEQLSKKRALSIKQKQTLGKVLARNNQEAQRIHENWAKLYESDYAQSARILAAYHKHQQYYRAMADDILAGKVPERGKFLRMFDNKYSKKVLAQAERDAKYAVGDYLLPRASFSSYKNAEFSSDMVWARQNEILRRFGKSGGFVLVIESEIRSAAQGAKRYKLLPVGETIPIIVEERYLKKGTVR